MYVHVHAACVCVVCCVCVCVCVRVTVDTDGLLRRDDLFSDMHVLCRATLRHL